MSLSSTEESLQFVSDSWTAINPADGEKLCSYPVFTRIETSLCVEKSSIAFARWSAMSTQDRCAGIRRIAELLFDRQDALARQITLEMGKPIFQSHAEIEKCSKLALYLADEGPSMLQPTIVQSLNSNFQSARIEFHALGPVLAIMPWNFPFWQFFRFGISALISGNSILLKHSPNTFGCARAIERLVFDAIGIEGLVQSLIIDIPQTEELIAEKQIQAITFTGSTAAGRRVAGLAGANLKKSVLELGGSDPYLVFEDCDLERAVEACVEARLINAGQSCVAGKRFIVEDSVYDRFLELSRQRFERESVGDPFDPATTIGPLARRDLVTTAQRLVSESVALGARVVAELPIPNSRGFYFPPCILAEVTSLMPVFCEETFAPIMAVSRAKTIEEMIDLANRSDFGLGSAVFTSSSETIDRCRRFISTGMLFVNGFVRSDQQLPFGGVKHSGWGRELSAFGVSEFCNIKSVVDCM